MTLKQPTQQATDSFYRYTAGTSDYKKWAKAKVAEVLMATSPCRTTVTEGYQSASTSPGANAWGCETTTSNSRFISGEYAPHRRDDVVDLLLGQLGEHG